MSTEERDRLKVLHEVKQGHLTQAAGADQLGVSERWVRELVRRLRGRGDSAVIHGLRGKVSNRRLDKKTEKQAIKLYKAEYSDFGPTLATEYLSDHHSIVVSKETLRKWLTQAGLWQSKPRRVKQIHTWRARRMCRGELVQWDTSIHDWLEGRSQQPLKLIAMIDDATNELFAAFTHEDSTVEHMRLLRGYLKQYGRPLAFYTDKAALFHVTPKRIDYDGKLSQAGETQIGRALRELGIELILAHSPQAKGRVERCFGVLQDRLVKGLRKAGADTLEQANQYLVEVFLPIWNRRFRRDAASEVDAHRPVTPMLDLASILSRVESRCVANDWTVSWDGQLYQIPREAARSGLRSTAIRVEQRLDGSVWARVQEQTVQLSRCERRQVVEAPKSVQPVRKDHNRNGRSQWMANFNLTTPATTPWKSGEARIKSG